MWSATRPTETGRYGWRPSPAEPGRVVDIVNTGVYFTIDATGSVVEGGEWWQGPIYAWEVLVNAELLKAAKMMYYRLSGRGGPGYLEEREIAETAILRAEQQPADTRDATIERLRAAIETALCVIDNPSVESELRAALGEKP